MLAQTLADLVGLTWRRRMWSAEQVQRRQSRLLRQGVRDAYDQTEFYRDLLDRAGVKPDSIRGLEDLRRLPIVTKKDYRRCPIAGLVRRGVVLARCKRVTTSGSTGVPTVIYYSRREAARRDASFARARLDAGARWLDRVLSITRPGDGRTTGRFLSDPYGYWFNRACRLEEAPSVLLKYRPDILWGFPSRLYLLARTLEKTGIRPVRPRLIFSSGETVDPQARRFLECFFGAAVRMFYASWEFGVIGSPCLHGHGYHICTDDVVVECVRNGAPVEPGEQGEVVITQLASDVMPFLRYAMGDLARMGSGRCSCGHPGPWIRSLDGRTEDMFRLSDGSWAASDLIIEPVREASSFLQYRVIQETEDRFRIQYVAAGPVLEAELTRIRDHFKRKLLASEVIFEEVPEIEVAPSGKVRRFVSRVSPSSARLERDGLATPPASGP